MNFKYMVSVLIFRQISGNVGGTKRTGDAFITPFTTIVQIFFILCYTILIHLDICTTQGLTLNGQARQQILKQGLVDQRLLLICLFQLLQLKQSLALELYQQIMLLSDVYVAKLRLALGIETIQLLTFYFCHLSKT